MWGDTLQSVADLRELVLFDLGLDGLEPVRLGDVADVFVLDNAAETYARINGEDGVLLAFYKQSNYATAHRVREPPRPLRRTWRRQTTASSSPRSWIRGDYIRLVVNSVLENLAVGAAAGHSDPARCSCATSGRTLIVAFSIPISVTFAIVLMYFSRRHAERHLHVRPRGGRRHAGGQLHRRH